MALQWMFLSYVVAAEAVVALLLTFPAPKPLKYRLVDLIALVLQPRLRDPPLRRVPASRFVLEERAPVDVHLGDLHRRREDSVREIDVQSSKECHPLCFSMPPLLVHLPHLQVSQGC